MKFNLKVIGNIIGILLLINGLLMLTAVPFGIYHGEGSWKGILVASLVNSVIGFILYYNTKDNENKELKRRDGYLIVILSWIAMSLFGMLPYIFTDQISNVPDAFFETVSGYTTTGASILNDIEILDHGILYWRSLTQWIGGMGIIVLAVAILPFLGIGGMQLFVAEAPGVSVDKLQPRIKETAMRLWQIYISFTVVLFFILWAEGMNSFEAVNHAMTTFATGGFSTKNASIGYFESPLIQYTIILFMFISATNFTLTYFAIKLDFKKVFQNEEFRIYSSFIIFLTAIVFITLYLIDSSYAEETFRSALFSVVSIITTTGFTTVDFTGWTEFITILFFILMFFGASAGSTSGGIKIVRHVVLLKNSYIELKKQLHQQGVFILRFNNSKVPQSVVTNILAFMMLYVVIFSIGSVIMTLMGVDFITAIGSVAATLGNIGPGIGDVGPASNFSSIPDAGKYFLSLLMLIGRLELLTFLLILTPAFWKFN
ncbi:MAG: potassium transporter TrkG [Bacteroidota bacterium]|jgi:trk system potassium uptake protein TrkH|nr:potassium transporter [Flammeovirgaceae bacterium]MEC7244529.1 potassium transporter TrkG [Bacteroidota bacterium]MEC7850737.1 potassium transporter TrkG [Bacteroidota bacterium]MEC8679057.1 potassium transporter TrkG [Bacteroidota bacterium]MEC8702621.1 potassium transporter TrkG [Bacteroidota bacterium]|tara:strand:+ start:3732 stop:5189 length:1458 start_codon:yes stop_codon:yes gene_type:complete